LGGDRLIEDGQGKSLISREDFAVAILDEIERPQHRRQRFTAAY
jgi:putative NADH-flavin reductase